MNDTLLSVLKYLIFFIFIILETNVENNLTHNGNEIGSKFNFVVFQIFARKSVEIESNKYAIVCQAELLSTSSKSFIRLLNDML